MTDISLKHKILQLVNEESLLIDFHTELIIYRDKGGNRDEAYSTIEEKGYESNAKDNDDLLLELLDIVAGFCSPHLKVW